MNGDMYDEQHDRPAGRRGPELAIAARERGRARLRTATAVAGVASLVAAGAVAFNLPGPAHSGQAGSTGSGTTSSPANGRHGDDGTRSQASTSHRSVQAPSASTGTSHATSGAS
jgi:hypothetical protein